MQIETTKPRSFTSGVVSREFSLTLTLCEKKPYTLLYERMVWFAKVLTYVSQKL